MFTQPEDLTDDAVAETLERGWGLAVHDIAYAAVGFGSHHWSVVGDDVQWFVTADDLDARVKHARDTRTQVRQRLASALSTACALQQRGCSYVVAPTLSGTGSVLEDIDERYVVAVYPHIDGRTGSYGRYDTQAERFAVVDRLVEIHAAGDSVKGIAGLDDFGVPSRDRLMTALAETSSPWSTGPFAERTRSLLDRHAGGLTDALNTFDDLVALVRRRGVGPVVTHGEPHRGNVIFTSEGVSLIDWDTTLLAPCERDLWSLIDEDPEVAAYYSSESGRSLNNDALRLYRLWWDLCEVSLYVTEFHAPHVASADTEMAWAGLQEHLDPSRWTELT